MQAKQEEDTAIRDRMWKEMAKSPFVMIGLVGSHQHSEPMTAQLDPDANGEFWFYCNKDNRIAGGGEAMAQFVSKGHDVFACIHGTLTTETRPEIFDKYWSKQTEAWFEGGKQDPNIMMLRFDLKDAEIWEGDQSLSGKLKMLTGQTIKPSEAGSHAEVAL
ncbi:pyridoxamine 5'-phosphate oxidase family protein [Sphingomonas qomolangmaensis]|uniref:Pyridoxamine 5'-phosphate oxidase family protein n=1 Tax=Sphingomonas qomolangmaensis TaxID=2918765 RepID=A0ABY5L3C7_9SPHN|nr:pyridoxamine 5'-phosphate oxidase family protein [Sphingomonas qomolangmaensis]UUL81470.1 pyridoxamine 5'-phosphate oxidase family protein [Sphingomonas qomolangmaensis]